MFGPFLQCSTANLGRSASLNLLLIRSAPRALKGLNPQTAQHGSGSSPSSCKHSARRRCRDRPRLSTAASFVLLSLSHSLSSVEFLWRVIPWEQMIFSCWHFMFSVFRSQGRSATALPAVHRLVRRRQPMQSVVALPRSPGAVDVVEASTWHRHYG